MIFFGGGVLQGGGGCKGAMDGGQGGGVEVY